MRNEDQKLAGIENGAVSDLLSNLKRVEAPGDFDFHVKARIAQGRPADRNASLMPSWLRVAVPLVLLVFVGGYFGFRTLNSPVVNVESVAQVEPEQQARIALITEEPSGQETELRLDGTVPDRLEIKPSIVDDKIATSTNKNPVPEKLISPIVRTDKRDGGGSIVFSSNIPPKPKVLAPPKDIKRIARMSVADMLSPMGIDASYSNSTWKVGGVKLNSMAERSGLKTGDVIEAINDQNLTEKTTLASPFSGKSIRVRRDGKSVQIDLKP